MGRKKRSRTTLRAKCHVCGEVVVDTEHANLLLRNTGNGNALLFRCPECLDMIQLEGLSKAEAAALMALGVVIIDQMVECLLYPLAPALTELDAEKFEKSIEHVRYLATHAQREHVRYCRELLDAQ